MATAYVPTKVHLVGSLALNSVEEVFRTAGTMLGRRLKRAPDGEPGSRRNWIAWQYPLLRASGYLKPVPQVDVSSIGFFPLQLAQDVRGDDIEFGELGYAREARASYVDFVAARARGYLAADARFQVCLPTPLAVIGSFCRGKDMLPIEKAYERAMSLEVAHILKAIPHRDLCIQWDVCSEMVIWDGQLPHRIPPTFKNVEAEILQRMSLVLGMIPQDVEMGVHLCYGDLDGKHFCEPRDATKMVSLANALSAMATGILAYIHMPVPINRDDEDFYRPFAGIRLNPKTELFLGLVHRDGAAATRRRIEIAHRLVEDFGIATECGIARNRRPELIRELLQIHAETSQEP